jgi:hypothetical protein
MSDSFQTFQWEQLARRQKIWIIAAAAIVVVLVGWSWLETFQTWQEVRVYERQAEQARQEKDEALANVAKIATQIKIREQELEKVEVKRDAKKADVEKARVDVDRDRAEYERAVRARVTNAPSTDELCERLAASGHPCQPR